MTQHDPTTPRTAADLEAEGGNVGTVLMEAVADAIEAMVSMHEGAALPPYIRNNMMVIQAISATDVRLFIHQNGTNHELARFNRTAGTFEFRGALDTDGGDVLTGGGDVISEGGTIRTLGGLMDTDGGPMRTGAGTIDSEGGVIRSGAGLIDSEGGNIQAGGGLIDSEGGIVRSGAGNIDTEGGDFDAGFGDLLNIDNIVWGANTSGDYVTWASASGFLGYENGVISFRIASANDTTFNLAVYNRTTANAANVQVDSGGGLRRSTSSGLGKSEVEALFGATDMLMALQPSSFVSDYDGDQFAGRMVGFIAEELCEAIPSARRDGGLNFDDRTLAATTVTAVQEIVDALAETVPGFEDALKRRQARDKGVKRQHGVTPPKAAKRADLPPEYPVGIMEPLTGLQLPQLELMTRDELRAFVVGRVEYRAGSAPNGEEFFSLSEGQLRALIDQAQEACRVDREKRKAERAATVERRRLSSERRKGAIERRAEAETKRTSAEERQAASREKAAAVAAQKSKKKVKPPVNGNRKKKK